MHHLQMETLWSTVELHNSVLTQMHLAIAVLFPQETIRQMSVLGPFLDEGHRQMSSR